MIPLLLNRISFFALLSAVSVYWSSGATYAREAAPELPSSTTISRITGDANLKSSRGQEIKVYSFAPKDKNPAYRFLVQGGIHGNESQASQFVIWLARRYARGESLLNKLSEIDAAFDFLPYANPDGIDEHNRYNARGVNLNRNFEVLWGLTRENPGDKSFSEPETAALKRLFYKQKYAAAVDIHGYINWIVGPSSPQTLKEMGHKVSKNQVTAYSKWEGAIKRQMAMMPGYQYKTGAELGDGGAFEDWAFWSQNTLAYCLEMDTWFRFVPSNKRQFGDIREASYGKVDKYILYETFIFRMFEEAVAIKLEIKKESQMAAK